MKPTQKPTLALSSCWCSGRHTDGDAMLREMASLGFSHAELSHGVRITLVPGILKAVEAGVIKISSVHNFCPLPTGVTQAAPNLFEPSVADLREHDQWVRQTKRTLDFAAQVGARVMVLHLGSVKFFWLNPVPKLNALFESKPEFSAENGSAMKDATYAALQAKTLAKLRARMGPFWQRVKSSLDEIREYALEKKVALGCENRERVEELPLDSDFGDLFSSLTAPNTAGYWHDAGHAHIKETMGFLNHREQLEKNAGQLLGFHLHDVNAEGSDHQAIGNGSIDFDMVSSFWKPHHLLVLELSPKLSVDDVKKSKSRVESLMNARFKA